MIVTGWVSSVPGVTLPEFLIKVMKIFMGFVLYYLVFLKKILFLQSKVFFCLIFKVTVMDTPPSY